MMVETAVEESQIIVMFVSVLVGELQSLQLIVGHVINHLGLVMDTVMIQQIVKCVNMMVEIAVEVTWTPNIAVNVFALILQVAEV